MNWKRKTVADMNQKKHGQKIEAKAYLGGFINIFEHNLLKA
jgi:hypothetical protein